MNKPVITIIIITKEIMFRNRVQTHIKFPQIDVHILKLKISSSTFWFFYIKNWITNFCESQNELWMNRRNAEEEMKLNI